MIDARLVPDAQEVITPGEAVAGMILNGLGFANRPLSLTPQFFANKPLDLLFRPRVSRPRCSIGLSSAARSMKSIPMAVICCLVNWPWRSVPTKALISALIISTRPAFPSRGDYVPDSDEQAIRITHGYSKDHRPDLKQAVLELMVSQDGGVPLVSKSWDGNTSDTQIFQERAEALMTTFARARPRPGIWSPMPNSTREDNAVHSGQTWLYHPDSGHPQAGVAGHQPSAPVGHRGSVLMTRPAINRLELCHYGMAQRWLVVSSQAAMERAEESITKAQQREGEAIEKQLFHLQAQRFETPEAAQAALTALATAWQLSSASRPASVIEHKRYAGKGRPTATSPSRRSSGRFRPTSDLLRRPLRTTSNSRACFVLGTNIRASQLSDAEVIRAYKGQARVEGGFRFLKDPLFFVSSLFVKKPSRIQGLLMVMTLALLVYSRDATPTCASN